MVANRRSHYYTFRVIEEGPPIIVEAKKWNDFDDLEGTYRIDTGNPSNQGCSCPAYTSQCKHRKCVEEAVERGYAGEFHRWRWDEKQGWIRLDDIRSIEEMDLGEL